MESSCIYCGCGCRLNYEVNDGKIINISGIKSDDVSEGKPCIKGLTIKEVYNKNRIERPTINGRNASLKEALDYIYQKTKKLAPSEVFFNTSGKLTNENNYIIQKFARVCYGTPNIDSCCGRLCHNATVMGMKNVFGAPNLTLMSNYSKIDTILIIGSEPEKSYPVFYNKLIRNNVKIIRVHSFVKGCSERECIITIRPGSECCLLNGLIRELIKHGFKSFVDGFELLKETVKSYDPEFVCETCGLYKDTYNNLIKKIIKSKTLGVFHGMGLTQHVNSLENIHSLLNLVLLKKAIILSLRGEINVQGSGDIGGSPGSLPTGFLSSKESLEKLWGDLSDSKGLNIIEALMLSPVKAVFLTEFNPFKSMPDLTQLKNKLRNSLIFYFGSYHNETSKRADVVIPIASLIECDGSITNGERRLRRVNKVIEGTDELWVTLSRLASKFSKSNYFNYSSSREVLKELSSFVPDYKNINFNLLWEGADQWADKSVKHERFMPEHFDGLDNSTSRRYPFLLTTIRSAYSFLSNEITKSSNTLNKLSEPSGFYFNPDDAKSIGLINGIKIKITSVAGSLTGKAFLSERLPRGVIGAYIHYSDLLINSLFPLNFDEESFTPNFKSVAVNVCKL